MTDTTYLTAQVDDLVELAAISGQMFDEHDRRITNVAHGGLELLEACKIMASQIDKLESDLELAGLTVDAMLSSMDMIRDIYNTQNERIAALEMIQS